MHEFRVWAPRPKSVSVGLIQNLPWELVGSATAQYVERAPKPAELFSRGAHDATATFDIGNPNLTTEVAKSVEVGLRRAKGPFRFEATAYYTKFDGFIFRRLTGNTCDESSCVDPGTGTRAGQPVPQGTHAPDPIYYPKNGQSAATTESDRRECNRWATTQPGRGSSMRCPAAAWT